MNFMLASHAIHMHELGAYLCTYLRRFSILVALVSITRPEAELEPTSLGSEEEKVVALGTARPKGRARPAKSLEERPKPSLPTTSK